MKIIRIIISLVLLLSTAMKMTGNSTAETMFSSLPIALQWTVLAVEIFLAIWLLSGRFVRTATFVTLGLFSVFCGAIILEMTKANPIPCGCFGSDHGLHDPQTIRYLLGLGLAMNVAIMCALAFVFFNANKHRAISCVNSSENRNVLAEVKS